MLSCEHTSHYRTSGPYATLKEVSDILVSNIHTSILLKVILEDPGSPPPVPPDTKEQIPVLLLGCCPSIVLFSSPHVTVISLYLLMLLRLCWEKHQTLRQHVWMSHSFGAGLPV